MGSQTWKTLPLGCGGLFNGFDIAPDGTAIARSDVGGVAIFSGKIQTDWANPAAKWQQVMNTASLKDSAGTGAYAPPGGATTYSGALDVKVAYTRTQRFYALMPKNGGTNYQWALYSTDDSGAHWTQRGVTIDLSGENDGGSNGVWRRCQDLLAVDPNNENVVIVGMRNNVASGASGGAWITTDGGATNNVITLDGTTPIPQCTSIPGGYGIRFDANYTGGGTNTTTVGGVLRTKRILVSIGGSDVYESVNGGANYSATGFATAAGRSDFAIMQAKMDFDGVLYCLVTYAGANGFSALTHLWRYAGAAARGAASGTGWVEIGAATGFPNSGAYPHGISGAPGNVVVVDPRNGHQGRVNVYGPNGIGTGQSSSNANLATANSITWTGGQGGEIPILTAPSYDVPYLNSINSNGLNSFADSPDCQIDANGNCYWTGNQGVLWLFTQSDLTTPVIPSYNGAGITTYSVALSRGNVEATVSQEVVRPPGGLYPIIAAQDVGVHQSGFVQGQFATAWYPGNGKRSDATSLCYAPGTPSHMAARCSREGNTPLTCDLSGYSDNYGYTGTWVQYATQPDPLCAAAFTGSIDNFGVLTVSALASGNVLFGGDLYTGSSFNTDTGTYPTSQLTNTNGSSIPYREGTYQTATCIGTGFIDNGAGGGAYNGVTGSVLTVTASGGLSINVVGRKISYAGVVKGAIVSQLTNTNSNGTPGQQGTYQLDTSSATPSGSFIGATPITSQAMSFYNLSIGGQSLAIDPDHHLVVPFNSGAAQVAGASAMMPVILSSQARDPTNCNWQIVYDLPVWDWTRRGYASGTAAKPLAVDQVTAGVAYAAQTFASGNSTYIWKSTNYGANSSWSHVGTITNSGNSGNMSSPLLRPVRFNAGHLFFTGQFTSGTNAGIWFSNDSGATWTAINLPSGYTMPQRFDVGALYGTYPKIYLQASNGTTNTVFFGIFDPVAKTATWSVYGATGNPTQDFPASCNIGGITTLTADPVVGDLIYSASGSLGFSFGGNPASQLHAHW